MKEILTDAANRSAQYEWIEASKQYRRVLEQPGFKSDSHEVSRITELVAACYFKGAFQAGTRTEFKQRMQLAEDYFGRAAELHSKLAAKALSKEATCRRLFSTFWIKENLEDRQEIIAECIKLGREVARGIDPQSERRELAESHKDLLTYISRAMKFAKEAEELKELFEEAASLVETALEEFESLGNDEGFLEILNMALFQLIVFGQYVLDFKEFRDLEEKIQRLGRRAAVISEKLGTPYAISLGKEAAGWIATAFERNHAEAVAFFEAGTLAAESTNDSLLIGETAAWASEASFWAGLGMEDGESAREAYEKGITMASRAVGAAGIPLDASLLSISYGWSGEGYFGLAEQVETEPLKKKEQLVKAIRVSRQGVEYKEHFWLHDPSHTLSKALNFLARLETDPQEKARLLNEALTVRAGLTRRVDVVTPRSWDSGIMRNYLALIKADLSSLQLQTNRKIELLSGAVSDMQKCIDICGKWAIKPGLKRGLARYEEWYGDILLELHRQTLSADNALGAVKAYEAAIRSLTESGVPAFIPSVRWKIARTYDIMGDYEGASDTFRRAAQDYKDAEKRSKALSTAFGDLASYMIAWALIEDARQNHSEEKYTAAAEAYTRAAETLGETRTWSGLKKHYQACSLLEQGEGLSRQERSPQAQAAFSAAARAFDEAKETLSDRLSQASTSQAAQELEDWLRITEGREKYCRGKIELEEARSLDKSGDRDRSAGKYRSASKTFKSLLSEVSLEQSRKEISALVLFCEAWAKMKEAETELSPELYAQAAETFAHAREWATKKYRLLALASAALCRALEAGTRFRLTQDTQLYAEIKRQLQTAADHYQEGGFESVAKWTQATQRLFDALVYLADAEVERERKTRTELYHLAEKHLELAAQVFSDAGYSNRKEEVLKQLTRIRSEKEVLLAPLDVLSENPSTAGAYTTPVSLIRDQALGLERFETANIVGNLSLHEKEVKVGSELTFELEIANVGRTAATLVKLENILPEGFEFDRKGTTHKIEENHVSMKGKRLDYLKTEEVKVVLKAARKGDFELRPRILFVDEKGTYRTYEFEPVPIQVRDLGISSWLKGTGR